MAASAFSTSDASASVYTLTNSNMTATSGASTSGSVRSTNSISGTSKLYVEFLIVSVSSPPSQFYGLAGAGFTAGGSVIGSVANSVGISSNLSTYVGSGFTSNYSPGNMPTVAANDVVMLAVDYGAGKMWFGKNNVWTYGNGASNPVTGTAPIASFVTATVGALFPAICLNNGSASDSLTLHAAAASQKYAAPNGFTAWDPGVKAGAAALMVGV